MDLSHRFLPAMAALAAWVCVGLRAQTPGAIFATNSAGSYAAAAETNGNGFLKVANIEGSILEDSTVLMTAKYMKWYIDGNASATFRLYSDSARYISTGGHDADGTVINLGGRNTAALFFSQRGRLCTIERGDTLCLVLHRRTDKKGSTWVDFRLVSAAKVNGASSVAATLAPMPEQGTIERDIHGGKIYTGHFNAHQISTAIDNSTTSLDLTGAVLPLHPVDFTFTGATNCIVYVKPAALRKIVPRSWKNVVTVGPDGARLVRIMQIADGAPFHAMYPFTVSGDSLTYTRIVPAEGWNTLVLPFTMETAPASLVVAEITSVGDSAITLEYTRKIVANRPYLFRIAERKYDNYTAVFKTKNFFNSVPATPDVVATEQGALRGTFSQIDIADGGGKWLLLAPDGYSFAPAAAGSFLSPFRCGIYNATGTKTITHK